MRSDLEVKIGIEGRDVNAVVWLLEIRMSGSIFKRQVCIGVAVAFWCSFSLIHMLSCFVMQDSIAVLASKL